MFQSLRRPHGVTSPVSRLTRRFGANQTGASAVAFSLALIPIALGVGAAIDLSQMNRYKAALDAAADTAAIAGVSPTVLSGVPAGEAQRAAVEAAALAAFAAEAPKSGVKVSSVVAKYSPGNGSSPPLVEVSYTASVQSIIGPLAAEWLSIGGRAVANAQSMSGAYTEIYILLDVSASMGLGVDVPTQTAMSNDGEMATCAFACHTSPVDTVDVARRKGYVLRFDAIKAQLDNMLSDLQNQFGNSGNSTLQIAIYGFDNGFRLLSPLGRNMAQHKVALKGVEFSIVGGGTSLRNALVELRKVVPKSGDGSSANKPKVVVLLITDGVANSVEILADGRWEPSPTAYPAYSGKWCWDQNPPPTDGPWYSPVGAPKSFPCMPDPWTPTHMGNPNQELAPLDPAWCLDLKKDGVRLMTLYSRYDFPRPTNNSTDWRTKDWRYPLMYYYLIPKLQGAMRDCASSPNDSYTTYDNESIKAGLGRLVRNVLPVQATRLVK